MHHVPHNNGWVRVSATRWRGVWCGESVSTRVVQKKNLHIWAHLKDRREEKSETRKMEMSSNKIKYLKNSTEKPRKQKKMWRSCFLCLKMWRSCFLCLCGYLSSSQFFPIQCISERATKRKYFLSFHKKNDKTAGVVQRKHKKIFVSGSHGRVQAAWKHVVWTCAAPCHVFPLQSKWNHREEWESEWEVGWVN